MYKKRFYFLIAMLILTATGIDSYGQELRPVKGLNGKWGFVDETSKEVIPFKYDEVGEFSEGLVQVQYMGRWGIIDKTGKEITPTKYSEIGGFSEGLARVRGRSSWGFIDKTGKEAIPLKYIFTGDFSEGLARVRDRSGLWGFIDKTGKEVIPPIYFDIGNFSEGLVRVKYNGKWGFINKTGNAVISFKYDDARDFSKGLTQVKINRKWGYIDKDGKEVIPNVAAVNQNASKPDVTLSVPPSAITQDVVIPYNDNEPKNESQHQISNTDIITLRNGDEIKARVTEISLTEIKYKRSDNLDGPTIIIPRAEVFAINYENGTREVINPINASGGTRTQAGTQAGMSNTYQEKKAAFGVNGLMGYGAGFDDENSFIDYGVGANFSYIVGGGFRLAGEFGILWGKSTMDIWGIEVAIKTKWTDFSMYGHYLIPAGEGVVYPLLGFGMANLAVTAGALGYEETDKEDYFMLLFGSGLGYPISRNKNLVLNVEARCKYVFKENAFRFHLAPGLAYKF